MLNHLKFFDRPPKLLTIVHVINRHLEYAGHGADHEGRSDQCTEPEQDAIAVLILEELADERRWDEAFARSQEPLAQLVAKVREDIRAGHVRRAEVDEL